MIEQLDLFETTPKYEASSSYLNALRAYRDFCQRKGHKLGLEFANSILKDDKRSDSDE